MQILEDQPIFSEHHYQELRKHLGKKDFLDNGIFFTFRHRRNSRIDPSMYFSDSFIFDNWKYFLKRLNTKVLKSAHTKRGRKLQNITVEHHHNTNHFLNHIHTIIVKPAYILLKDFTNLAIDCWNKTPFGTTGKNNEMFALREVYSDGIIKYQFRESTEYTPYPLSISIF